MPVRDFHEMREFYRLFPFDDFHRFHRPAALVANAMSGAKTEELLRWLQPDPSEEGWAEADLNTFAAFGVKPPLKA